MQTAAPPQTRARVPAATTAPVSAANPLQLRTDAANPLQLRRPPANPLQLKATAPIQRFTGAKGTNQAGKTIDYTLNDEFTTKHVGDSAGSAIEKTQARLDAGDLASGMIRAGSIGNTVATEAEWDEKIKANKYVIPQNFYGPEAGEEEEDDFDPAAYDESEFSNSDAMNIKGWDVRLTDGELIAKSTTIKRKVGGMHTVENLDVSIDINHCTQ